jgi:hypothetical protein
MSRLDRELPPGGKEGNTMVIFLKNVEMEDLAREADVVNAVEDA